MKSLYRDILLDHYKYPRNKGTIENGDFNSGLFNPSCGDSVIFTGILQDTVLVDVKFEGVGCVLSIATASILSEYAKNKNIDSILSFTAEQLFELIATQPGLNRARCVTLALEALQKGIQAKV